jgi:transposase-like protein
MVKRQKYSAELKARLVLEVISGARSQAEVAREHGIRPELLARWQRHFLANAGRLFDQELPDQAAAARLAALERALRRVTVELDVAKKAAALAESLKDG